MCRCIGVCSCVAFFCFVFVSYWVLWVIWSTFIIYGLKCMIFSCSLEKKEEDIFPLFFQCFYTCVFLLFLFRSCLLLENVATKPNTALPLYYNYDYVSKIPTLYPLWILFLSYIFEKYIPKKKPQIHKKKLLQLQ